MEKKQILHSCVSQQHKVSLVMNQEVIRIDNKKTSVQWDLRNICLAAKSVKSLADWQARKVTFFEVCNFCKAVFTFIHECLQSVSSEN